MEKQTDPKMRSASDATDVTHVDQRRVSYLNIHSVDGTQGAVMSSEHTSGKAMNFFQLYSIIVIGASAFLYGYDNAIVSPVAALYPFIDRYQGINPTTGTYVFTANNQSLIFSTPIAGSVIGALMAPIFQKYIGRKWILIGSYFFGLGGNFLQIFAPNLIAFVIGRLWANYASGLGAATAPLYLSEVCTASVRGAAVASSNILALLAAVLAALVVLGSHNWQLGDPNAALSYTLPLGCQAIPTGVLLPFTFFLCESPHWLAHKDRMDEARKNLRKLRGFSDHEVDDEIRVMKMAIDSDRAAMAGMKFWHLFNKENFERTIVAGSMFSFNQISGIILTTTYATVFLQQLNIGDPYVFTTIAQICVFLGTCVAPFTMDRSGRRPTMLSGMVVLFFIDLLCGILAFFTSNRQVGLTLIAFSMIFNFFWAASFYSVSNLLPAEIASVKMREYTMSYTIAWAQTTAIITTFAVPQLTSADGANLGAKAYLIFAGCMALVITFVFFLVPETKGRTFAEIDELYARNVPRRQWTKAETSTHAKHASVVPAETFARASVIGSVAFPAGAERRKSTYTGIAQGGASGSEKRQFENV